jgi:hypothetical protein
VIPRDVTKTPSPIPPDYDWRKESWVNDDKIRALSYYIAYHVLTAMAGAGDDDRDENDQQVFVALNPAIAEKIWKSPAADEIIDPRLLCALAQGIDELITKWIETLGSIESKGMPKRPTTGEQLQ